jgi:uncharacterized protein YidB (DUF937 family)
MALMDLLEGQLSNAMGSAPHRGLLEAATAMLTNSQQGGLSGVVQHLTANGLGNAVASWVGNGPNQSVSPQQLNQALGSDRIAQLAQQAGLSPGQASAGLATMLPHLIDKLTPGGKLPDSGMMQQGLGWLESHLTSHQ